MAAPGLAGAEGEARGQITLAFAGMTAALNDAHISVEVPVRLLGRCDELSTRAKELLLIGVRAVRTFPGNGLEDLVEVRVAEKREVVLVARAT